MTSVTIRSRCWIWLTGAVLVPAACGERREAVRDETPAAAEPAASIAADAGPPEGDAVAAKEEPAPPDPRQQRLLREWERYADVVIEHSVSDLPEDQRAFMRKLLEAAEQVEELHLLQVHPSALEWRDRLEREGGGIERGIFHRYRSPWCLEDLDPECNALSARPPREYGRGLWPAGIDDAEVGGMVRLINGRELLSPFTVVLRGADGRLGAVPYAADNVLGPRMRRLAAVLREAAELAPQQSLGRFLRSRADAFESNGPFPYDDSDYDWIRVEGEWEVTVGPYDTRGCPHGIKAMFRMLVGRANDALTAVIRRLEGDPGVVDEALAGLIDRECYTGRSLGESGALRVVDVWIAAGDARRARGAKPAYHLPGRGRAAAEGLAGRVVLANHVPHIEAVDRERARRMFAPEQAGLADPEAALAIVAFSEMARGLGLPLEARITDPRGRVITLGDSLRGYAPLVEELKADALGMWLLVFSGERGWVDRERERAGWVTAVGRWLGSLRAPLADVHARAAAVQLGWHLDAGSLEWSEEHGRLSLDFSKMPGAAEGLAAEVLGIHLAGDHARARALSGRFLDVSAGKDPVPRGGLDQVRVIAIERAGQAAVLPPAIRHLVHDTNDQ